MKSKIHFAMESKGKKHFVLVHGACHGGWCWYKVATLLNAAGHLVTVPDLGASGIDSKQLCDLSSIYDYAKPVLDIFGSISPDEKVILVGHSYGGFILSLAMEGFPNKIAAAVFVTAFMPKPASPPILALDQFFLRTPPESWLDCRVSPEREGETPDLMIFGPHFLSSKMYQCCPPEDLTLATMLMRWFNFFKDDLSCESILSEEKYGFASRVYIVCKADETIREDLQCWMIENNPVKEVKEIEGSDHMPMISKPQELCCSLLEIAKKYS